MILTEVELQEIRENWTDENIQRDKEDVFELMYKNFDKLLDTAEAYLKLEAEARERHQQ